MKTKIIHIEVTDEINRGEVEKINGMKFKNEDELYKFSMCELFRKKGLTNYYTSVENLVETLNDEDYPTNEFLAYVYVEE